MEQKDLRAYIQPVLKRWWLILAVVPVVTVATYFYYDGKPKVYQASTELYFQPSTLQQLVFGAKIDDQARVENAALLIQTNEVGERAYRLLAKKGQSRVPGGSVEAQAIEKSSFIAITATAGTAQGAARLANAYAVAFVRMQRGEIRREARKAVRAAEGQLEGIPTDEEAIKRREALEQKIQDLKLLAGQPSSNGALKQVNPAVPPAAPIEHDPSRNAIFAFVVGLMLAIGGAYGLELLSRRIASVEDVEEIYGVPVLTEIPQVDAPAPRKGEGVAMASVLSEPFQRLQMNLDLLARERPVRTILVASAAPEEGKSVVARNLGLAYREAGHSVAVLDADFRKPSLGGLLAANDGLGLSDVLAGRASFGQVVQEVEASSSSNGSAPATATEPFTPPGGVGRGELAMVPAGEDRGNLSTALSSAEMRQTLRTAADTYGTAIVDSPPLLAVADALPLLSQVDAVVLVMRIGVSTRDSARRLMSELGRMPGVFVAGIAVNGIPRRVYRARSYDYGGG